jgi:hypothetical protein
LAPAEDVARTDLKEIPASLPAPLAVVDAEISTDCRAQLPQARGPTTGSSVQALLCRWLI